MKSIQINLIKLKHLKNTQRQKIEQFLAKLKIENKILQDKQINLNYLLTTNRQEKLNASKIFYKKISQIKFDSSDMRNFEIKQIAYDKDYKLLNEQLTNNQQLIDENKKEQQINMQKIKNLYIKLEKYEFINNNTLVDNNA